jgi:predicted homoserine dehydrogenase-like protein
VLYGEATIVSKDMVSEVATLAKRDLRPGETVGEIGMPDFFGRTLKYNEARAQKAIPLGLVPGGKVLQPIAKGDLLTEGNFAPDRAQFVYQLRKMQDEQIEMEK